MSWLLFMDESGHDHKSMPMEVRGGVAIHCAKIWPFIQGWHAALKDAFGPAADRHRIEIKGSKLLSVERFKWANQMHPLDNSSRYKGVNRFLTGKLQKIALARRDFTAYGQACLGMADRVFDLLEDHDARVFAALIPRGTKIPPNYRFGEFLRKDHAFLLERFFYFLEKEKMHGLLVMDQTEKRNDQAFTRRLQNYFAKTSNGRHRTQWIVPAPLFVDSDMSPGVQAADLCIYCINWGFRRREWAFDGPGRDEIRSKYGGRLGKLQFTGDGYHDGRTFPTYGIFYVPDPYTARANQERSE